MSFSNRVTHLHLCFVFSVEDVPFVVCIYIYIYTHTKQRFNVTVFEIPSLEIRLNKTASKKCPPPQSVAVWNENSVFPTGAPREFLVLASGFAKRLRHERLSFLYTKLVRIAQVPRHLLPVAR